MLKKLGITQRVEVVRSYGERRDCLDQRWAGVASALGFVAVPLPNVAPERVPELVSALEIDAVLLSGGNSLAVLDEAASGAAPERDAFEHALVTEAMSRSMAVFGVCRGMQILNVIFGGGLSACAGHAGTRHVVTGRLDVAGFASREVNSFHDWCIGEDQLARKFTAFAQDVDGNVEAFYHESEKVAGIMWHPEREQELQRQDQQILEHFLL